MLPLSASILMSKLPFTLLICFALMAYSAESKQCLPLKSGSYTFRHQFAEQPNSGSAPVTVKIKGNRISVFNHAKSMGFPKGLIEKGTLIFHQKSQAWIISTSDDDINANEVGGCSDGPTVLDLMNKIYWSC